MFNMTKKLPTPGTAFLSQATNIRHCKNEVKCCFLARRTLPHAYFQ